MGSRGRADHDEAARPDDRHRACRAARDLVRGVRQGAVPAAHPAVDYFGLSRNSGAVALSAEDADELLRALAHPARREILRQCWREPKSAGALTSTLGLAAASTSEHLKVLRKTGL